MSLLPTVTHANANNAFYIRNVGGNGEGANPVPAIKAGDVFNALRIGNVSTGMVLIGGSGSTNPLVQGIRGGYPNTSATGSQVNLGASLTSPANVVLTDSLTTINTSVNIADSNADLTVGDQISLGGNLVFTNGQSAGASIKGWFQSPTQSVVVPNSGAYQAIANPTGGPGLYAMTVTYTTAGNDSIAMSLVAYWTGAVWYGGSAVSAAGPASAVISANSGATALQIAQSGGGSVTAQIIFYKIMGPSV